MCLDATAAGAGSDGSRQWSWTPIGDAAMASMRPSWPPPRMPTLAFRANPSSHTALGSSFALPPKRPARTRTGVPRVARADRPRRPARVTGTGATWEALIAANIATMAVRIGRPPTGGRESGVKKRLSLVSAGPTPWKRSGARERSSLGRSARLRVCVTILARAAAPVSLKKFVSETPSKSAEGPIHVRRRQPPVPSTRGLRRTPKVESAARIDRVTPYGRSRPVEGDRTRAASPAQVLAARSSLNLA